MLPTPPPSEQVLGDVGVCPRRALHTPALLPYSTYSNNLRAWMVASAMHALDPFMYTSDFTSTPSVSSSNYLHHRLCPLRLVTKSQKATIEQANFTIRPASVAHNHPSIPFKEIVCPRSTLRPSAFDPAIQTLPILSTTSHDQQPATNDTVRRSSDHTHSLTHAALPHTAYLGLRSRKA